MTSNNTDEQIRHVFDEWHRITHHRVYWGWVGFEQAPQRHQ